MIIVNLIVDRELTHEDIKRLAPKGDNGGNSLFVTPKVAAEQTGTEVKQDDFANPAKIAHAVKFGKDGQEQKDVEIFEIDITSRESAQLSMRGLQQHLKGEITNKTAYEFLIVPYTEATPDTKSILAFGKEKTVIEMVNQELGKISLNAREYQTEQRKPTYTIDAALGNIEPKATRVVELKAPPRNEVVKGAAAEKAKAEAAAAAVPSALTVPNFTVHKRAKSSLLDRREKEKRDREQGLSQALRSSTSADGGLVTPSQVAASPAGTKGNSSRDSTSPASPSSKNGGGSSVTASPAASANAPASDTTVSISASAQTPGKTSDGASDRRNSKHLLGSGSPLNSTDANAVDDTSKKEAPSESTGETTGLLSGENKSKCCCLVM